MTKKKLELTAERKTIIDQGYARWREVGLRTTPADFEAAETAIAALYEWGKFRRPYFVRLSSPFAAELYINLLTKTWPDLMKSDQLGDQLRDQLWGQLRDQLGDQLRGQLWGQLGDQLWGQLGVQLWGQLRDQLVGQLGDQLWGQLGVQLGDQLRGQLVGQLRGQLGDQLGEGKLTYTGTWFQGAWDAWLWGFYETGKQVGASYSASTDAALNLHAAISQSCGAIYPFRDFCIITDRPEIIAQDDQNRLHRETGPAVLYRDGYSLFAWHGVRVPGNWITDPSSVTPKIALTHSNVEQRRAACEIVTWVRILDELKARTIDRDEDPEIGELVEVDIPDIGRERFLRVTCGTKRQFALPVPPTVKTALDANAWTYDIPADLLKMKEFRT